MVEAPLILTLALEARAHEEFERLRRTHFPPQRNLIPAHVTLFHHLPGTALAEVQRALTEEAVMPGFHVDVIGVRFLGQGVAFEMASPELQALHGRLARRWAASLTAQDRQGYRPHLTIQNKADPDDARRLHKAMRSEFQRFNVAAEGLLLWRYLGGPWEALSRHAFSREGASDVG